MGELHRCTLILSIRVTCHFTANLCAIRTLQLQVAQSNYVSTTKADIVQVVRQNSPSVFILKPQCQRGRPSHVTPYPYLQFTTRKSCKPAIELTSHVRPLKCHDFDKKGHRKGRNLLSLSFLEV